MGKITKKKIEKRYKDICKKTRKKKKFGKEIDDQIKAIAIQKLDEYGGDGMEKIIIDDISIEISSEDPRNMALSAQPESMASASAASANCFHVCYNIGGKTICRKICW